MNGRNIIVILAVLVVVVAGGIYMTRDGADSPGQPSPHAIDQSN